MNPIDVNPRLLDKALEIVIICQGDGQIIYANEAALADLGYDDDILDHSIYDIFPSFVSEEGVKTPIDEIDAETPFEVIAYRKNKTCFHSKTRVKKDEEQGLSVFMTLNTSEEVHLKKEITNADAEVAEAGKVKTEFVANVTHELRTPVNGILGNTRELLKITEDSEQKRYLSLIEKSCDNMNAIINSILDFSKLSAGKFTLENREFDFRSTIDFIKNNHQATINEKGLNFFVTVSPDVPRMVIGDELRIVQIINNLISNATKFTSIGKIALEVIKTGKVGNKVELFFLVVDTGIGIDKADLSKLFKSFSQVDASITRNYGGTGLGLNITKQLVEMMGGSISCESEKGKGSTFSFSIWLEVPAGEEVVEETAPENPLMQYMPQSLVEEDETKVFGSEDNIKELNTRLSKLILCVEMENWEKAEMFADTIKQLTTEAPREIKTLTLQLKMAVQKENYEKVSTTHKLLEEAINTL